MCECAHEHYPGDGAQVCSWRAGPLPSSSRDPPAAAEAGPTQGAAKRHRVRGGCKRWVEMACGGLAVRYTVQGYLRHIHTRWGWARATSGVAGPPTHPRRLTTVCPPEVRPMQCSLLGLGQQQRTLAALVAEGKKGAPLRPPTPRHTHWLPHPPRGPSAPSNNTGLKSPRRQVLASVQSSGGQGEEGGGLRSAGRPRLRPTPKPCPHPKGKHKQPGWARRRNWCTQCAQHAAAQTLEPGSGAIVVVLCKSKTHTCTPCMCGLRMACRHQGEATAGRAGRGRAGQQSAPHTPLPAPPQQCQARCWNASCIL